MPRTDPLPRPPSARCDCEGCGGCQRWNFNALVNDRDLHGYYAAPFVGTEARSIMCAYSGVGGFPACGSPLLNDLLRGGGWDGHVVSDCTRSFPQPPQNPCVQIVKPKPLPLTPNQNR